MEGLARIKPPARGYTTYTTCSANFRDLIPSRQYTLQTKPISTMAQWLTMAVKARLHEHAARILGCEIMDLGVFRTSCSNT